MPFMQCRISNFWSPIKTLQKQSPYQSNAKTSGFCYGKFFSHTVQSIQKLQTSHIYSASQIYSANHWIFGPILVMILVTCWVLCETLLVSHNIFSSSHQRLNQQKFMKKFSKFKMVQLIYLSMQKKFNQIQVLLIHHRNPFSKVYHYILFHFSNIFHQLSNLENR